MKIFPQRAFAATVPVAKSRSVAETEPKTAFHMRTKVLSKMVFVSVLSSKRRQAADAR